MTRAEKLRIIQARRLADAAHRQVAAAVTVLSLLERGGPIEPALLASLIGDVSANLRSVLRTAQAAIDALEGRTNG